MSDVHDALNTLSAHVHDALNTPGVYDALNTDTYSHEKYEPCVFDNGTFYGTPEEAFATSAVYLRD